MFFQQKIKSIDQSRIEAAIENFEKNVDFEFIPVIAHKSSYVEHITWMLSLIMMLILTGLIETLFQTYWFDTWMPHWPFYVAAPIVSFLLGFALDKSDRIDRFFISKHERVRQVQEAAEIFFYRHRLHEVKSHNALMLYISVMERQIVLMPDPRHSFESMPQVTAELLARLQSSFKKGDYEQGLVEVIGYLQNALAVSHKKTHDSGNNVPNKLIWLDDRTLSNIV